MKKIPLTQGKFALVDDQDYDYLMQWNWIYASDGYAKRNIKKNNAQTTIAMHRVINKTPDGLQTDHINGDGLDNRRSNLRTATCSNNQANQRVYSVPKSSIYKGVSRHKATKKWIANITAKKKAYHIGLFSKEIEAARAYDKAALKLHGEFARINGV